jgi:hypothetical protein
MSDETATALERLLETITYKGKVYDLFIQKAKIGGRAVWDVTYAAGEYFGSGDDIPANALLYGFTGSPDLEDTASSCLIRLEQKKLYPNA